MCVIIIIGYKSCKQYRVLAFKCIFHGTKLPFHTFSIENKETRADGVKTKQRALNATLSELGLGGKLSSLVYWSKVLMTMGNFHKVHDEMTQGTVPFQYRYNVSICILKILK